MRGLRTLIFDVKDLAAAKRFYAEALETQPYFDEPFYVGFDVGMDFSAGDTGFSPESARRKAVSAAAAKARFGILKAWLSTQP